MNSDNGKTKSASKVLTYFDCTHIHRLLYYVVIVMQSKTSSIDRLEKWPCVCLRISQKTVHNEKLFQVCDYFVDDGKHKLKEAAWDRRGEINHHFVYSQHVSWKTIPL